MTKIAMVARMLLATMWPLMISAFSQITTNQQLRDAVRDYMKDPGNSGTVVATTYGHPIGTWDVSTLADFSLAFEFMETFNEDITAWVRS